MWQKSRLTSQNLIIKCYWHTARGDKKEKARTDRIEELRYRSTSMNNKTKSRNHEAGNNNHHWNARWAPGKGTGDNEESDEGIRNEAETERRQKARNRETETKAATERELCTSLTVLCCFGFGNGENWNQRFREVSLVLLPDSSLSFSSLSGHIFSCTRQRKQKRICKRLMKESTAEKGRDEESNQQQGPVSGVFFSRNQERLLVLLPFCVLPNRDEILSLSLWTGWRENAASFFRFLFAFVCCSELEDLCVALLLVRESLLQASMTPSWNLPTWFAVAFLCFASSVLSLVLRLTSFPFL